MNRAVDSNSSEIELLARALQTSTLLLSHQGENWHMVLISFSLARHESLAISIYLTYLIWFWFKSTWMVYVFEILLASLRRVGTHSHLRNPITNFKYATNSMKYHIGLKIT